MQTDSLDELEGALDRVARRLAESSSPVPKAAARVRRLEREPWIRLLGTGGLVALAIYSGRFMAAGALALIAVPHKVAEVRKRRDALEVLNTSGDLLALEVKSLTDRHVRLGIRAALSVWIGSLFIGFGAFSPRPLVGLVAGLLALALAVFLLRWSRPKLRRALADLGAQPKDHWSSHHLAVVFFLFLPVFALIALVTNLLGWNKDADGEQAAGAPNPERGDSSTTSPAAPQPGDNLAQSEQEPRGEEGR